MAHKTVWKYNLYVTDVQDLEMPEGAKPLAVGIQDGAPVLWVLVDPSNSRVQRRIMITGTGHVREDRDLLNYIGYFQLHLPSEFVGHVFDGGEEQ